MNAQREGAPEVAPSVVPALAGEVPQPDSIPRRGLVGRAVDERVCKKEETRSQPGEVVHAGQVQGQRRRM